MPVDIFTIRKRSVHGTMREVTVDIGLDATYGAGGELLTAAQLNQLMPEYGGGLVAPADAAKIESFVSEARVGGTLALNRATGAIQVIAGAAEGTGSQTAVGRCRIAYDVGSGL